MEGKQKRSSLSPPEILINDRREKPRDGNFTHSEKRHLSPESAKIQNQNEKELYKRDLLIQVEEKRRRDEEEKQRLKLIELREEERVRREIEEMNRRYKEQASDREYGIEDKSVTYVERLEQQLDAPLNIEEDILGPKKRNREFKRRMRERQEKEEGAVEGEKAPQRARSPPVKRSPVRKKSPQKAEQQHLKKPLKKSPSAKLDATKQPLPVDAQPYRTNT